ncbi:4-alpha-glucanotransferase [soil metagenome]
MCKNNTSFLKLRFEISIMVIQLHIKYKTRYGQAFFVRINDSSETSKRIYRELKMEYLNDEYWHIAINTEDLDPDETFSYSYLLKQEWRADEQDLCKSRMINLKKVKADSIDVFDEWQVAPLYENVFLSKPFAKVLNKSKTKNSKKDKAKKSTHQFRVFVPYLHDNKVVCMAGSAKEMGNWSETEPVLLQRTKDCWSVTLNLSKEQYPISYKFGVYDLKEEKIIHYEDGSNRFLEYNTGKDKQEIFHVFPGLDHFKWQGAGINLPVSALKSEQSWGVGDFTDLHLLIDWARETGMKLIQLLPINDTTATHTNKDSYPYASISAFALHPLYLNVRKLSAAAAIEFSEELLERVAALNNLPSLDYKAVTKIKTDAIRELYYKEKHFFKDDMAFFEFFDMNRYWLVPYAAFCYLRDNNNSADASKWEDYNIYDEVAVQELVSPDNADYDEIGIHYFTQFHLHLQLLDAVEYAHKNGIMLKGDLPIGVGRHSAETWMHPTLFHMDMQAGAPPDAFAVKGQNWEFPTYNWEEMGKNNYAWWRQRMEHMSNYFDAIRIDHILGFFRIWSIPHKDVEGILGVFAPALAFGMHEFESSGIYFDEARLCDPYITDDIIDNTFPGNEAWIKENIISDNKFRPAVDTQQKLAAFFKTAPSKASLRQGLFDLITNVVLVKDPEKPKHYHFRISMQNTESFRQLDHTTQQKLGALYQRYFFEIQDNLWKDVGQKKLNALQLNTDMLLCAEDLGMVPDFVESVLIGREILSLQVQRMPKKIGENFSHPKNAIYLSVVTPSTHDMSTIREWWEEEKENIQYFYNNLLGQQGTAPFYCEPWICKDIISQHLYSPAMWAVFLIQDIMAMDAGIRRENPAEERINVPANPDHNWDYRMHVTLEQLLEQQSLTKDLKALIKQSGR